MDCSRAFLECLTNLRFEEGNRKWNCSPCYGQSGCIHYAKSINFTFEVISSIECFLKCLSQVRPTVLVHETQSMFLDVHCSSTTLQTRTYSLWNVSALEYYALCDELRQCWIHLRCSPSCRLLVIGALHVLEIEAAVGVGYISWMRSKEAGKSETLPLCITFPGPFFFLSYLGTQYTSHRLLYCQSPFTPPPLLYTKHIEILSLPNHVQQWWALKGGQRRQRTDQGIRRRSDQVEESSTLLVLLYNYPLWDLGHVIHRASTPRL